MYSAHRSASMALLVLTMVCGAAWSGCGYTGRTTGSPDTSDDSDGSNEIEGDPAAGTGSDGARAGSKGSAGSAASSAAAGDTCVPAVASEKLRARESAMLSPLRADLPARPDQVSVRDLFDAFNANCGQCHVDRGDGDLQLSATTFAEGIDSSSLDAIRSNNPGGDEDDRDPSNDDQPNYMPPDGYGGMRWDKRLQRGGDGITQLAAWLEAYLDQGKPSTFSVPGSSAATSTAYLASPSVGVQLTNMGSCVPDKQMIGSETTKTQELDKLFAAAKEFGDLPNRLDQTDLFTFDAKELAKHGVISYSPAYTLWADNAKKMRMVRVPRGESIRFDKDAQEFSIPANTRIYKTFMKKVTDLSGHESYRKMETRIIVSRPDEKLADGSRRVRALFGTYAWNEAETEAVLVKDPLRNGSPFRDRMVQYVTDEQAAYKLISQGPLDNQKALEDAHLTRHYAIPGSDRCVQCHMGSYPGNFTLGFTPLQLLRRPQGKGGVLDAADRDELNQLQRFIDYGLITGMASPDDVVTLENSQGDRKPRNEAELQAQAYVLGNCAHCHNPYGFPSVNAPELKDLMNFLPLTPKGGIFQFPLDRTSPRIARGPQGTSPIAYITPSLYDRGDVISNVQAPITKKSNLSGAQDYILAPWRSLIYRNIDTPFSYVEDNAIYPRMPRHTPGYDCKIRKLFGLWMTSIPARLKEVKAIPLSTVNSNYHSYLDEALELESSSNIEATQPYEEVSPMDPDYPQALSAAALRVRRFLESPRLLDCQSPGDDIQDPKMSGVGVLSPEPVNVPSPGFPAELNSNHDYRLNVPSRSHWFVSDFTDPPPPWAPRRPDWKKVLVERKTEQPADKLVFDLFEGNAERGPVKVSGDEELRKLALEPQPFGLWRDDKKTCRFPSNIKTVGDFPEASQPPWMSGKMVGAEREMIYRKPDKSDHVYETTYGGQIYRTICYNCHGKNADSISRNADTISDLTGGNTRVANFVSGLFGPLAGGAQSPGANRNAIFAEAATGGLTVDDLAGRYFVWMALGGTQRSIPTAVLDYVSKSLVLGYGRKGPSVSSVTANMLMLARQMCAEVLPGRRRHFNFEHGQLETWVTNNSRDNFDDISAAVYHTGEGEMWERICAYRNPLPVRVVTLIDTKPGLYNIDARSGSTESYDLFRRGAYGPGPVGDHTGKIQKGISVLNRAPWCVRKVSPEKDAELEAQWAMVHPDSKLPYCPDALLSETNRLTPADVEAWGRRGAMNAGLAVYLYLDAVAKGEIKPLPDNDKCEQLTAN